MAGKDFMFLPVNILGSLRKESLEEAAGDDLEAEFSLFKEFLFKA